jgi:eukaryotic-like serine/threonine-protein kinase
MRSAQAGSQLDHYVVEDLLARSNTASIFRGADLRTGHQVAIKIPHPEVEGDLLFYERFLREQEIGERLDHPAIVKAFKKDDQRSQMYLVMELVEGQLLRQVLNEQGKLPVERSVRIALAICEALEYIHSQGVVHRDLKPENVIIDAEDRIKLIDFGIASQAGARRLTFGKLSQVMGTPDYISPEQVKGKRGDARTDIYALGVMLYEMLTGETPFAGNNPFVSMHNRLVNDPVPPREIDPSITPELQEIIYRALERNPKSRYSSAREFVNDLLHQDRVGVADRPELRNWQRQRTPSTRTVVLYGMLAMIPLVIFGLLFFVARHQ